MSDATLIGMNTSEPKIGAPVDAAFAQAPQPITLNGRFVTLVPLDPVAHATPLYQASHGPEREDLWRYLFDGPYSNLTAFEARLLQMAWHARSALLHDS